jgi:hypothetical protein
MGLEGSDHYKTAFGTSNLKCQKENGECKERGGFGKRSIAVGCDTVMEMIP